MFPTLSTASRNRCIAVFGAVAARSVISAMTAAVLWERRRAGGQFSGLIDGLPAEVTSGSLPPKSGQVLFDAGLAVDASVDSDGNQSKESLNPCWGKAVWNDVTLSAWSASATDDPDVRNDALALMRGGKLTSKNSGCSLIGPMYERQYWWCRPTHELSPARFRIPRSPERAFSHGVGLLFFPRQTKRRSFARQQVSQQQWHFHDVPMPRDRG